jgi:hypothetical protein
MRCPLEKLCGGDLSEAISKNGFWFKIKAAARFNPEEYWSISRT